MAIHDDPSFRKECPGCRRYLLLGEFGRSKNHRFGVNPRCKACVRERFHARSSECKEREKTARVRNRPAKAQAEAKWRSENRNHINKMQRARRERERALRAIADPSAAVGDGEKWCKGCCSALGLDRFSSDRSKPDGKSTRCAGCCAASAKVRRAVNKDKIAEDHRVYYVANRDRVLTKNRDRYLANVDRYKETSRAWAEKNPDKVKEYALRYYRKHPEKYAKNGQIRRLRILGIERTLTPNEWHSICSFYGWGCAYCGDTTCQITLDHVLPVSRGGAHAWNNVVPACPTCNRKKGNRTPGEWLARMKISIKHREAA